ncbi:hypothetical protein GYMLUDRAFT_239480 [Collybiopsis luxurians FD-317 M1]|nr:hypothetical protein GYMLUDRAFT_239480 [Collybiopsis luxurians FD-317 M1]
MNVRKEEKRINFLVVRYINYIKLKETASNLAHELVKLSIGKEQLLIIDTQTSPTWQLAHAYFAIPTTIATEYSTLSKSSLIYSFNKPSCIEPSMDTVTQSILITSIGLPPPRIHLEYIGELIMLFVGMTTGYGRVESVTSTSICNCLSDLETFQPSIIVSIPAVW